MAANGRRVAIRPNTDSSKSETHFSLFSFDKNIAQEYMKHQLLLTVLLTMLTTSRSFNVASRRVVFNDLMKMKSTTDASSEELTKGLAKDLASISTPNNSGGDNRSDYGDEARRKKKPVNSSRFRQHVNPLASRYQQVREEAFT